MWLEYEEGAPKTLYDMVRLAAHDITQAPAILYDFVAEVRQITEVPVLVAFDALNEWDNPSPFPDPADPKKGGGEILRFPTATTIPSFLSLSPEIRRSFSSRRSPAFPSEAPRPFEHFRGEEKNQSIRSLDLGVWLAADSHP